MILMNDFKAEPPALREAMLNATRRVLDSGWYILGREALAFEGEWAKACGTAHGVGTGNGMDAIEISLRSANIEPGDEVITTPMTAFATILAIIRTGATPVFADIDPDSALLSIDSVKRCLSERTRAIILVHLYGQVRKMNDWLVLCKENGLILIEDCAQAHLAAWQGRPAGSHGHAGAFSFYPTKNLGAPGDAGMIVTSSDAIAQRARQLRNYGQSDRYHHPVLGMNSRLDELQAAILSERLRWLLEFTERRRAIANAYRRAISNPLISHLAQPEEPSAHVYHLFVLRCERRTELAAHLHNRRVQSLIHYPVASHHQDPCKCVKRDSAGLGYSEKHAQTCLSLPCHPQMSDTEVERVIEAVNTFAAA